MTSQAINDAGTFLAAVVAALTRAGSYNRNDQSAPAAVLWPDKERQWEPLLPELRTRLPLVTVGPYHASLRQGPAYWVRCMLNGTLEDDQLPTDATPIVYLPGFSAQELRAVETCPRELQPLAELQYRGLFWRQRNGRDWTLLAFLQSGDGGLGIEVGADHATREAVAQALVRLADEPVGRLKREAPLRAPFFQGLLHPDEARTILQWLDEPDAWRQRRTAEERAAFVAVCQAKYEFHPEQDGPVTAAGLLGQRNGAWDVVWRRFEEAPASYPNLPDLLRRGRPTRDLGLFMRPESWPQDNEALETLLRERLAGAGAMVASELRKLVRELESAHGRRREWVWARLGRAPLATATGHLAQLAMETEQALGGTSVEAIAAAYAERGWRADAALLDALASASSAEDAAVVKDTSRALYEPWADASARSMQALTTSYRGGQQSLPTGGTCMVFVDGLRFDVARRLEARLTERGLSVAVTSRLAPIPTITASGKPLAAPPLPLCPTRGFDVATSAGGPVLVSDGFRKLLLGAGVQILSRDEVGAPGGVAWTESGDIDKYGHDYGWRLAHQLDSEVSSLTARCEQLLQAGWESVLVVTDHGWLLLPGGMPKVDLPEHLTDVRKGRCARFKDSATATGLTAAWHWDAAVRVGLAPGISCFEANKEYEHGGLSPQECITPVVNVTKPRDSGAPVSIEDVRWVQYRCRAKSAGAPGGAVADVRVKANDPSTSLATEARPIPPGGTISVLVSDEDSLGRAAFVVVLSAAGEVLAQTMTTVGGEG